MFTKQANTAFSRLQGSLPENVLSEFTALFGDCRAPLEHRGQINVQAAPFIGERIDVTNIDNFSDNPTYASFTAYNPSSQFIFDGDQITHVDNGFSIWAPGVSWWQYAMAYWAYFQNSTIKNLKVEKIIKDGYKSEDRKVLEDVNVTFSFDPSTCEGTVTVTKHFVTIQVLVKDKDAGSNSPAPTGDGEEEVSGPMTGPDGQPYPGMVSYPLDPPPGDPVYFNSLNAPSIAGPQDYSGLKPPFGIAPNDPVLPTITDTYKFSMSPEWLAHLKIHVVNDQEEME